jgi:UDP-3-O-[3-hydroxymyristoyl] glucosamine N-acyltransferase
MEGRSFSLAELAEETDCQLIGNAEHLVSGVSELDCASPHEAAYVAESRFLDVLGRTQAGVVFITPKLTRPPGLNYLLSDNPAAAFQKFSKIIAEMRRKPLGFQGIHPSAVIHPSARLGQSVQVGPHAVIERDVVIGDNSTIGALVYIGPEVVIGQDTQIHPNATIHERTHIGNRVLICSGCVLGSVGFGFRPDEKGQHQRYEHLGNVDVGDDVEIGANTTIDRARLKSTRISRGTKIDNQVQIAHNCKVGQHNIIVSQVGMAGSVETGDYVILAGRVCVNDHITICNKAVIAACTAVLRNITSPGTYIGFPAIPIRRHHRLLVCFHNLDKLFAEVQKLRKHLNMEGDPMGKMKIESY